MESTIKSVYGRMILDSRGLPTVEAQVVLDTGEYGIASVPSGKSTGEHEAHELRDDDENVYFGKGVTKAIKTINEDLGLKLINRSFTQETLDKEMISLDGTENKENFGANSILAISCAFARAQANKAKLPLYAHLATIGGFTPDLLPTPEFNIINGGLHGDTSLDVQEFHIIPTGFDTYQESIQAGAE